MTKGRLWSIIFNLGLLVLLVGGLYLKVDALSNMYVFFTWVIGIIGALSILGGSSDPDETYAKAVAKGQYLRNHIPESIDNILWVLMILVPVGLGHIAYGVCWFLMWVFVHGKKDKVKYFLNEYEQGRLKVDD